MLLQLKHGGITASGMAKILPQRAYLPLTAVRTGAKRYQVQGCDVPARSNLVWDIIIGGGPTMYVQGGDL